MAIYSYPYSMHFIELPTSYDINANSLNLTNYGYIVANIESNFTIKLSAICTYPNNSIKVFSKNINILVNNNDTYITADEIQEAFIYDIENKSIPKKVEFIIYTNGYNSFKWTFNIGGV